MSKRIGVLIFLTFVLLSAQRAARAEEYVVMSSSTDRYAAGALLPAGSRLKLEAKQKLVLLNSAGETRQVVGPFEGSLEPVTKAGDGMTKILARIVGLRKAEGRAIGAMRGYWRDNLPSREIIDIESNATRCVSKQRSTAIALRAARLPQIAKFWREGSEKRMTIRWTEAKDTIPWPDALEIGSGSRFFVLPGNALAAYVITISVLPASFPSKAHEAAWLWTHGCRKHAWSLIDYITAAATAK